MAAEAERAGMDAFICKPYKLEEIEEVYLQILEGRVGNRIERVADPLDIVPSVDNRKKPLRSMIRLSASATIFLKKDPSEDGVLTKNEDDDHKTTKVEGLQVINFMGATYDMV